MSTPEANSAQQQQQKIFNPWNARNKKIKAEQVQKFIRDLGLPAFRVQNLTLFQNASVHKSYVDRPDLWAEQSESGEPMVMAERPPNCLPLQDADNEELEFIGDSLLGCVVALYLRERYAGQGEGFFTRLRTRIVNNKMLGQLAMKIGLSPWLIISRHVEDVCDGRHNLRILGSMLEAWIGALYIHERGQTDTATNSGKGFLAVQTFLVHLLEKHVDFSDLIADDTNFKDQLLRWFQAEHHQPPRYKEVDVQGPPHDRIFTMGVLDLSGNVIATSTARNKKVAEQEASRLALQKLQGTPNSS
jgi:ribonuclease-3